MPQKITIPPFLAEKKGPENYLSRLLRSPGSVHAKHRNKLIDLILLLLQDALRDPNEVADLLLLQLDVGVKGGEVHLALEGELELQDVTLIEGIVDGLVAGSAGVDVPYGRVLREQLQDAAELVLVGNVGEHGGAGGVEVADGGVQALPVRGAHGGFVKGSAEGVEGDVDGVGVGADLEEVAHDLLGLATELVHELGKVLDPVLDEGGLDDLNLNLLEDVAGITEAVGGLLQELGKVRPDGGIDKDGLVQVRVALGVGLKGGDGAHGRLLEHTEGVALGNQLVNVAPRKRSLQQKHHILNHVLVRDEVQEGGKGLNGLSAQVLELRDELSRWITYF